MLLQIIIIDMFNSAVQDFFNKFYILKFLFDGYFVLILIAIGVYLSFKYRKAFRLSIIALILLAIYYISKFCGFEISETIYGSVLTSYLVVYCVILAPEINKAMEFQIGNDSISNHKVLSHTKDTKQKIVDAVFTLAESKIGALISFEQHISLEQYSSQAISLDADITTELLEQIFIKDSPLHDGGVIIRGNKILCAGAYYTLIQDDSLDKTLGSRHRAALGLSAQTDAITIIVSEETGHIHITQGGIMVEKYNKNELLEYLDIILS